MQHATFGGEALTNRVVDLWRQAAPNCEIVNSYGPTEMTISRLDANVESIDDWPDEFTMPVGEPFDGVETRLVAVDDGAVNDGVWELCLRGEQRFAGYLDPSDAEGRFLNDAEKASRSTFPFCQGQRGRMNFWTAPRSAQTRLMSLE